MSEGGTMCMVILSRFDCTVFDRVFVKDGVFESRLPYKMQVTVLLQPNNCDSYANSEKCDLFFSMNIGDFIIIIRF